MTPFECMFGHKSNRQQHPTTERQENAVSQVKSLNSPHTSLIDTHIAFIKQLRAKATAKRTNASQKMVTRGPATSPPAIYEVGESVYVKHKGKGKRLKRGFDISASKVNLGIILEAKPDKFKYKIQLMDSNKVNTNVVAWFPVDQITSLIREKEIRRRLVKTRQNCKCNCPQTKYRGDNLRHNIDLVNT